MTALIIALCVALYVLIGVALMTIVVNSRRERKAKGEENADSMADWAVGVAVMVWPVWTLLGIICAIGVLINKNAGVGE